MLTVVVAEGVAIALLAVLVLGLLRSHALILRALNDLGAGLDLETESSGAAAGGPVPVQLERGVVPATRHSGGAADLDGRQVSVPVRGAGRRTLLAFLSSGCSVCQTFWDELSASDLASRRDVPGGADVVVVTQGPEQESVTRLQELAGSMPVVQSTSAWDAYAVPGSPYFIYVEDAMVTGEGSSTTWAQVRDLMAQAVDDATEARRVAGRSGPGVAPVGVAPVGVGGEDPVRMDRELLAAGIHPGHHSMYEHPEGKTPPDPPAGGDRSKVSR